jgi:hypothetical protein
MKAEDYLELPDCITVTRPVVLDAKAKAAYEKLEREMLLEVDETTIDAGSAAVLTNKLLQLCNGAVYDESGKRWKYTVANRGVPGTCGGFERQAGLGVL